MNNQGQHYTVFFADSGAHAFGEVINLSKRVVIDGLSDESANTVDGHGIVRYFSHLGAVELSLTKKEHLDLLERPGISKVVSVDDITLKTDLQSIPDPQAPKTIKDLDGKPLGNVRLIQAEKLWNVGLSGQGIDVAILDTGIHADHVAFGTRVTSGFSCIDGGSGLGDSEGHGTQCAGVLGAGFGIGVAPKCTIHPVKIAPKNGGATELAIKKGFEWCLQKKIDVVSISYGDRDKKNIKFYEECVAKLVAADRVVVASGGTSSGLSAPGRCKSCIGVGSVDLQGYAIEVPQPDGVLDPLCERVELVAPGINITTVSIDSAISLCQASGSSIACPHVAGAAALLKSAGMRPAEIRAYLLSGSSSCPHHGVLYGAGILNCYGSYSLSKAGVGVRLC